MEAQDTITIAPSVMITIVREATLEVEGVTRMGTVPAQMRNLLRGRAMGSGIVMDINGDDVKVDVYLIVGPDVVMKAVSESVQASVIRSIEDLLGMKVISVDVHIEDVAFTHGTDSQNETK